MSRKEFACAQVPASTLLPVTVVYGPVRFTITKMAHGAPPRGKGRKSGINYGFFAEITAPAGGPTLRWGPDFESIRRTSDDTVIDDAALAQAVYEGCNWLVHNFNLDLRGNEWAPVAPVNRAARKAFGLTSTERRWPDRGLPDIESSLFYNLGPMAVAARQRQPAGPLVLHIDGATATDTRTQVTATPGEFPSERKEPVDIAQNQPISDGLLTSTSNDLGKQESHQWRGLLPASEALDQACPDVLVYDNQPQADAEVAQLIEADQLGGFITPVTGIVHPERVATTVDRFKTSLEVRARVLGLAQNRCEGCGAGPAFEKVGGTGYWELHHVQPLAEGGPDTVENAVCLCPNCHRAMHFARNASERREALYVSLRRLVHPH